MKEKKPKYLIIVESPSKAKKIQGFLSDDYIVKASIGHIADLAKGGRFGIGIDISNNFKPRYVLNEDKYSLIDELMKDAKECSKIFLCSDPDREGHYISWHLYERLKDVGTPMVRAVFNEIKKDKVLKALKEAGELDMNMVKAAESRRILDRIVGFSASPFLFNTVGKGLSAGRVQSVVVRMIIDNQLEIENFVPEDFWTLQTMAKKENDSFLLKFPNSLKVESQANEFNKKLKETDQFKITSVISSEEKRNPPAPLITSTLQRVMSKDMGVGAEDTMKAAQTLYESGYITYIRTDSVRASDESISEVRDYIQSKYELPKKAHVYKNKDNSQDAHECLRPSDLTLDPNNNFAIIDATEKKVYKVIFDSFVASQMEPAIYATLKVSATSIQHPDLELKATGKALIKPGFLEIFGKQAEGAIEIPSLIKGDIVDNIKKTSRLDKKATQPPPRYSEDKLIKELDAKGIGRPATYAQLLTKITDRNYVEKKGSVYHATDLGKRITNLLTTKFSFMDYDYTKNMEKQLDDIAHGKITSLDMLNGFYPSFKNELDKAYLSSGSTLCEKCKSPMVKRASKNGEFLACSAWPKCSNSKSIENV